MIKNYLKIGNLKIDSCVVLAPMAGVTNSAYKKIVRKNFSGLICSEMISDKGLLHGNYRTLKMSQVDDIEHPVSMQIFGSEINTMVEAAKYLNDNTNCDIIDINMGCPAPKITKNNSGSKLLLYPQKAFDIVSSIKKVIDKPLTIKMRTGYDDNINAVEFAKLMEKAGADAIFIHGRTTLQQYKGHANWDIIKDIKKNVSIPVIGNGDINSSQKARELMEYSKVDGVMIGRAALGNPWILNNIDNYLKTGNEITDIELDKKKNMLIEHFDNLVELKNERIAILEIRGHACNYFKSVKNKTNYNKMFQNINSKSDLIEIIDKIN